MAVEITQMSSFTLTRLPQHIISVTHVSTSTVMGRVGSDPVVKKASNTSYSNKAADRQVRNSRDGAIVPKMSGHQC